MIFLNINIVIGIIFLIVLLLSSIDTSHDFKQKYPELKVPKRSWAGRVLTWIKTIVTAIIPIWNLMMCYVLIFKYDEIKTKTIEKAYAECMKEKENVTHLSETSEGE